MNNLKWNVVLNFPDARRQYIISRLEAEHILDPLNFWDLVSRADAIVRAEIQGMHLFIDAYVITQTAERDWKIEFFLRSDLNRPPILFRGKE